MHPAGTQGWVNVASTMMQGVNAICPLGGYVKYLRMRVCTYASIFKDRIENSIDLDLILFV